MARVSSDQDLSNSAVDPALNQSVLQQNYGMYVDSGGNPSNYTVSNGVFSSGPARTSSTAYNPYSLLGGGGGGYGGGVSYAPYDVGDGQTKWDEFVQQMQLEQQKLQQAQAIENARLAQEKQLQEEQLAQQQKIADQNTVEAFSKNLMDMKGPADPYGYLFASRGLAAPQGYSPTAMPLPDAVKNSYQSEGVDLASAQKQLSGSSGPSFIQGYLGGMPAPLQQGPMGFQNSSQFANLPPGSPDSQSATNSQTTPTQQPNNPSSTPQMAQGGTLPGYSPGNDTVSAKLSPGEGVLTPQAVQMLGGPMGIQKINDQAVQHFATGGIVQNQTPLYQQQLQDLGNGLYQRGFETGAVRTPQDYTSGYDASNAGVPVRSAPGSPTSVGQLGFGANSGFHITGAPIQGPNNFAPNDVNGSTQWYPVSLDNGSSGVISGYDLQGNSLQSPYTGTKQSMNPDLPTGMSLAAPGVAMPTDEVADWLHGAMNSPMSAPLGTQNATSSPLLTGGVLNPSAPVNGPVMNLNDLDPYTRSLVDQYGRPQIPSAQALANMPSSGQQAYQNYVEKVAGGNFQDLLDQSNQLNSQGVNPGDLSFK